MDYLRCIVALPCLVACGASAPAPRPAQVAPAPIEAVAPPVHKRGGAKLIASVGPAGGTLELDNGARLDIPAGALGDPTELTFAEGTRTTAFSNKDHERSLGPTLEVAPALSLGKPLRLSIPLGVLPEGFTEADLALGLEEVSSPQRAVQGQGVQTRWDYLPAQAAHGRASAELGHLPGLRMQFVLSRGE